MSEIIQDTNNNMDRDWDDRTKRAVDLNGITIRKEHKEQSMSHLLLDITRQRQ